MIRTRIAPTPSGFLHEGNAYNFITAWLCARRKGGSVLLRIDDIDSDRFRLEYLEDIFFTLDRLGLDWDEGPSGPDDFLHNYRQSEKASVYLKDIQKAQESGLPCFSCSCSRSTILKQYPGGIHRGLCKEPGGDHSALRVRIPEHFGVQQLPDGAARSFPVQTMGDAVLIRRDGMPAYQWVSLAEDIAAGITLIARGEDLFDSSAFQYFLAGYHANGDIYRKALFIHHPLLRDSTGHKLSKRAGSPALRDGTDKIICRNILRGYCLFAGITEVPDSLNQLAENPEADPFPACRLGLCSA